MKRSEWRTRERWAEATGSWRGLKLIAKLMEQGDESATDVRRGLQARRRRSEEQLRGGPERKDPTLIEARIIELDDQRGDVTCLRAAHAHALRQLAEPTADGPRRDEKTFDVLDQAVERHGDWRVSVR